MNSSILNCLIDGSEDHSCDAMSDAYPHNSSVSRLVSVVPRRRHPSSFFCQLDGFQRRSTSSRSSATKNSVTSGSNSSGSVSSIFNNVVDTFSNLFGYSDGMDVQLSTRNIGDTQSSKRQYGTTSFVERTYGARQSNVRRLFHFPECKQGKNMTNSCDIMGQTQMSDKRPRPPEDYFYLGARAGEYNRPPLLDSGIAGAPAAAPVPFPGASDPSVMLQTASKMANDSRRHSVYANSMYALGLDLYRMYIKAVKANYGWHPRISGKIGMENFPLY